MNSQTHVLMGAALFGRPIPRLAWAAAAGSLVPDLPMYVIVGTLRIAGFPLSEIFRRIYWQDWWQIANAVGHNFLLWSGLALASGLALSGRTRRARPAAAAEPGARPLTAKTSREGAAALVFAFSASALLHSAIDFLFHRDDAHMHFWPLSDWRFRSPVSYWDANHYGNWFGLFEAAIGILLVVILFRRYRALSVRIALLVALALYVAVPAFFFVTHHG